MLLRITEAKYIRDYKIFLKFNDGKTGEVDLENFIMKETQSVFYPLKDQEKFRSFELDSYTLTWENKELDLAPEYLYFLSFKNDPELQEKFREWGYIS